MNYKLIPSFINPLTHFYAVPLTGPDRAVELRRPAGVPMVILDPLTDEWWVADPFIVERTQRRGPFGDQREALENVDLVSANPQP